MPLGSGGEVQSVGVARAENIILFIIFSPPPSPLRYESNRHYPRTFCTLPSFARNERPRWRPVELNDLTEK